MISIADSFRQEGWQKGRQEGRQEGWQEGIGQGVEKNQLDTAKRLLQENGDLAFIARITGLSIDKIKQLQEESSDSFIDID
jgi:predicted transposase/invertase (TIGR01784 family)